VDFIDKEDIVAVKVGQQGGEVAGALDGRAGGRLDIGADLVGDDMGQACLAETRRPVEQDMVECITARRGGGDGYFQVFLRPVLPGKIGEAPGPETGIQRCVLGTRLTGNNASYFASPPE